MLCKYSKSEYFCINYGDNCKGLFLTFSIVRELNCSCVVAAPPRYKLHSHPSTTTLCNQASYWLIQALQTWLGQSHALTHTVCGGLVFRAALDAPVPCCICKGQVQYAWCALSVQNASVHTETSEHTCTEHMK